MWTFCVQNRKQKHPKDSADAVNSTKSSEPGSKKAYRKTGSSQGFRSAWLRHRQPNSEVPCSHRSDPVMLQKLSLRKTNLYWVQLVPTVTQKGCCTSKSAPSWFAEKVDVSVHIKVDVSPSLARPLCLPVHDLSDSNLDVLKLIKILTQKWGALTRELQKITKYKYGKTDTLENFLKGWKCTLKLKDGWVHLLESWKMGRPGSMDGGDWRVRANSLY